MKRAWWALPAALVLAALILIAALWPSRTLIGGWLLRRGEQELDLRDLRVQGTAGLDRLLDPRRVDLRGSALTLAQMQELRARFPHCDFHWDVPISAQRFDSESEKIVLKRLCEDDLPAFSLFPRLKRVDAGDCQDGDALRLLAAAYPELDVCWRVPELGGLLLSSQTETLKLENQQDVTPEALVELAGCLPRLTRLELTGCGLDNATLLKLRQQLPGIAVHWRFTLCGVEVSTDAEELDISGHWVDNAALVEEALPYFTGLTRVVMSNCGISDEDMDALDKKYEDIRFVWTVHFGAFYLRTDATTFIATTFPDGYTYLTNEQLQPLRYCRDLEALDLGHMWFSDTTFLTGLTKLRYLILADNRITDITALSGLSELYYLELFQTDITDISPLLQCKALRHLNLAYCPIKNTELLGEMTWLERLWIPGVNLNAAGEQALKNLTETHVDRWCGSSTGGSWRTDEAYFVMRDEFGVYYMPG